MTIARIDGRGGEVQAAARTVRAMVDDGESVADQVDAIIAAVREGGHRTLLDYARRFDRLGELPARVTADELTAALAALAPAVRQALETAIANVRAVSEAIVVRDPTITVLPAGHRVITREVPVRRAAIYAPGGRNPYPSTVVMGVVTARAAGVEQVILCVPGGHPVMLAAAALCGADEVWRIGGAHAVAALAYGTSEIDPVDMIAGPGNLYVQEAKRRLGGAVVGIDGFAGPTDLVVIAGADAQARTVAADLLAQAEHGAGSAVVLVSDSRQLLDEVGELIAEVKSIAALVLVDDPLAALAFSDEFAPEHLELIGAGYEPLAESVRAAGCVFVGPGSGVAFGDYVAGSNHTLPTAGAARFASTLSVRSFRRLMSTVDIPPAAADRLAASGIALAEAEGFIEHARSMRVRQTSGS